MADDGFRMPWGRHRGLTLEQLERRYPDYYLFALAKLRHEPNAPPEVLRRLEAAMKPPEAPVQ